MTFYGECNILDKTVAWKEVYENLGVIKVVVIQLSSDDKRKHIG